MILNVACISDENQRELLKFKHASRLSWRKEVDYCYWPGMACDISGSLIQMCDCELVSSFFVFSSASSITKGKKSSPMISYFHASSISPSLFSPR